MTEEKIARVGMKILNGLKLTEEEFNLAKQRGWLKGAITYEQFSALHYEDDEIQGYLCFEKHREKLPDSSVRFCMWGIHKDEVKPEYLTPAQRKMLGMEPIIYLCKICGQEFDTTTGKGKMHMTNHGYNLRYAVKQGLAVRRNFNLPKRKVE